MTSQTQQDVMKLLRAEMDSRGWHKNDSRAGLAAIVGGESDFTPKFETGYSRTSNERIRMIFPSRVRGLSDARLNEIKSTDRTWFNFVYGGRYGNKPDTDDGFNYRGGGLNQLTFLDNYAKYGKAVGVDLVNHPELINTPRVAAAVAVEYMKDRFKGGDFDAMKAAVGVSIGEPDARKNQLYAEYTQSGEWDYQPGSTPVEDPTPSTIDPVVSLFLDSLHKVETFLKSANLYSGPIDDDPGPGLRAGLKAYMRTLG